MVIYTNSQFHATLTLIFNINHAFKVPELELEQ